MSLLAAKFMWMTPKITKLTSYELFEKDYKQRCIFLHTTACHLHKKLALFKLISDTLFSTIMTP